MSFSDWPARFSEQLRNGLCFMIGESILSGYQAAPAVSEQHEEMRGL